MAETIISGGGVEEGEEEEELGDSGNDEVIAYLSSSSVDKKTRAATTIVRDLGIVWPTSLSVIIDWSTARFGNYCCQDTTGVVTNWLGCENSSTRNATLSNLIVYVVVVTMTATFLSEGTL